MAKKYFIETCVTIYHTDVFEADSDEEFREMRDHITFGEYGNHVNEEILRKDVRKFLQNADWVDSGEVGWDWDGPVIGRDEFKSRYTSLEA